MKRHPKRNPRRLAALGERMERVAVERTTREAAERKAFVGGGKEQPGFADGHTKIEIKK